MAKLFSNGSLISSCMIHESRVGTHHLYELHRGRTLVSLHRSIMVRGSATTALLDHTVFQEGLTKPCPRGMCFLRNFEYKSWAFLTILQLVAMFNGGINRCARTCFLPWRLEMLDYVRLYTIYCLLVVGKRSLYKWFSFLQIVTFFLIKSVPNLQIVEVAIEG